VRGKRQWADEDCSRESGVRWSRDLFALDAEMLLNGRNAFKGVIDLLAVAGHILDAMTQIFQVVRVQLSVDGP
jgi:hypothetical protein